MTTYHDDGRVTLHHGDARTVAAELPHEIVDCIVTSPPYFGLRDYGYDGQIGAEQTIEEYVEALCSAFDVLRPVLRRDGTLWLNLGDSYAANWNSSRAKGGGGFKSEDDAPRTRITRTPGFRPKNLLMIPARVAIAMQSRGWILRAEIVWHKPNPMPESVTDRPTRAHEMIYLFSRSESYYYDAPAIAETARSAGRTVVPYLEQGDRGKLGKGRVSRIQPGAEPIIVGDTRNARDVWSIPTVPFKGAHFAVFPPELPRRCILAGSREGGIVLDPFSGSGTTGQVAINEGRRYIGIDASMEYLDLSLRTRFQQQPLDLGGLA